MVCEKQLLVWNIEILEAGSWWLVETAAKESLAFKIASMYSNSLGERRVRIIDPDSKEL